MNVVEERVSAESVRFGDRLVLPGGNRLVVQVRDLGDEVEIRTSTGTLYVARDAHVRVRRPTRVEYLDAPDIVWSVQ